MKFSIITPTHSKENFPYLLELFASIYNQTIENWEWVLYLNNGLFPRDIPEEIKSESRVKIIVDTSDKTNIGYIKNKAFSAGSGDILVEADHDDLLALNCLEELQKVFEDEKVGFAYSDSITYQMNGEFMPYNPNHGWTYRTFRWRGEDRISMRHFSPTSHALSYIWYAPDHVRAWRASVYKEIGGHDESLSVCDDHELCIRTYLATKMVYIPKPLYVYRITGDNTWLARNEAIQTTTRNLFDRYARALAERDADKAGKLKIDLGGGLFPYKDYKTVDLRQNADYVADLNEGIPLGSDTVGVINASHILEHLKDPIHSMREIHRVLHHGGWAFIEVPSTDGRGAWQDPTHVSYWNENSFFYYTKKRFAQFIDNTNVRFQVYKLNTYFPDEFMRDHNIPVVCAVLVAIKQDTPRFPGMLEI